jgi:hypothetical protein
MSTYSRSLDVKFIMNSVISEFTLLSTSTSLVLYGMQGPYLAKPLIQRNVLGPGLIACSSGAVSL